MKVTPNARIEFKSSNDMQNILDATKALFEDQVTGQTYKFDNDKLVPTSGSAVNEKKSSSAVGGIAFDKVERLIKTNGKLNFTFPEIDISKIDGLTFTITAFAPTSADKVLASL